MSYINNYAQQASQPDWYQANDKSLFASATSGSSAFNEWYEFQDRKQAVEFMESVFSSQSFTDKFIIVDQELYYFEDVIETLLEQLGENHHYSEVIDDADLSSLEPACLSDAVQYESRF